MYSEIKKCNHTMEKNFKRTLITTALPYANGPVHIGHLAGVYVPADIYARYLRLCGKDVVLVGGSDEHGVPITIKARREGVTPQDIVDRYHKIIKDSFEELGISFDVYSRTTSDTHSATASEFFRRLYDKGEFIENTSMQLYDEEAGQFLADRYVVGKCPHCGNERAYGDQCEACGTSLNATDLIEPKSAITGSVPVMRETKHWYLPLDKWEPALREWILEGHKEWKTNVYGQCKSWLDMGLQPRAVSRDLDWGIPVPVEGAEGKVLYVWFDAPIGYISNTKELLPDTWATYWKDPETRIINFIGKDNIVGCSGCEVHIVISGTGTHHNLKLLCGVEHFGVDYVAAYDYGVGIGSGIEQILLAAVLFKKLEFITGLFYHFAYTVNSNGCKRFFGGYQYFHSPNALLINVLPQIPSLRQQAPSRSRWEEHCKAMHGNRQPNGDP